MTRDEMKMNHCIYSVFLVGDGWYIICFCGWRSKTDHFFQIVGNEFDSHKRSTLK